MTHNGDNLKRGLAIKQSPVGSLINIGRGWREKQPAANYFKVWPGLSAEDFFPFEGWYDRELALLEARKLALLRYKQAKSDRDQDLALRIGVFCWFSGMPNDCKLIQLPDGSS